MSARGWTTARVRAALAATGKHYGANELLTAERSLGPISLCADLTSASHWKIVEKLVRVPM